MRKKGRTELQPISTWYDSHTTTAACAVGGVTGTAGRDSPRQLGLDCEGNGVKSTRITTCMKIRGSAVSLRFIFRPHPPED